MFFVSKRKIKFLVLVAFIVLVVTLLANVIVQFQLNKEIKHYKKLFVKDKDNLHDLYDPLNIKQIPSETIEELYSFQRKQAEQNNKPIDWNSFAYVNYVTDEDYLCNTLLQFRALKQGGTKAKLLLLISDDMLNDEEVSKKDRTTKLLDNLRDIAPNQVIIRPVQNILKPNDFTPWGKSFTKLLVFNQTDFDRVVYLDNDATVRDTMDELFFLPSYIKFAAPVTYWDLSEDDMENAYHEVQKEEKWPISLDKYLAPLSKRVKDGLQIYNHLPNLPPSLFFNSKNIAQEIIQSTSSASPLFNFHHRKNRQKLIFATNLMVIKPDQKTFKTITNDALPKCLRKKEKYDMDLINEELYNLKKMIYYQFKLFRKLKSYFVPEVVVLPFAKYGLLTGSIRNKFHHKLMYNDVIGYKKSTDEKSTVSLKTIIDQCKYIHFSDYPTGKPWVYESLEGFKCTVGNEKYPDEEMCDVWNSVFEEDANTRAAVCH
ncbi:LAFE_0G15566g1_1 [Lachancea fermentati]|uniref:LAFE_0G15566g1_1 n=1 Tax=Lachancea fermentati TaxID=4955 RepID=A0A1G4MIF3_LACFM|nr:LAFE_0G15566g1_1 [Lachancea fermentati]